MNAQTGSDSITVRPHPLGPEWPSPEQPGVYESADPWYRWLRAAADLYLAGGVDLCTLDSWARMVPDTVTCPAVRQLCGSISVVWGEPPCVCWSYWEGPPCVRGCEPWEPRERLRELMGVVQ